MADDVLKTDKLSDNIKNELRDFDEEHAYFLLCEIFAYAQATKDYAKFQADLNEWKKRFPIDFFSDELKAKIKYLLSKEFLETVLKGFIAFDELSQKDPSQGLEQLRKILAKAEKHKDSKKLDKDLDVLYAEYPLSFLKEHYPHIVPQLVSKSNMTRILAKFDSSLAFEELKTITEHPESYEDVNAFTSTIDEWKKLYNVDDFDIKYKSQVESTLKNVLDDRHLEEIFPTAELDLSEGQVIPIELHESMQNISMIDRDALYDFFKIVDKDVGDVNALFNWMCQYNRYINSFDANTKNAIVTALMNRYANEMPPVGTQYRIPTMESDLNGFLSLEEYSSMDQTKKDALMQLLGILSTGNEVTNEDMYQLDIISGNAKKAKIIDKAKIEPKLDLFMEKFPEDLLTPYDSIYLEPRTTDEEVVEVTQDIQTAQAATTIGVLVSEKSEDVQPVDTIDTINSVEAATQTEVPKKSNFDETITTPKIAETNKVTETDKQPKNAPIAKPIEEIENAKNDKSIKTVETSKRDQENNIADVTKISNDTETDKPANTAHNQKDNSAGADFKEKGHKTHSNSRNSKTHKLFEIIDEPKVTDEEVDKMPKIQKPVITQETEEVSETQDKHTLKEPKTQDDFYRSDFGRFGNDFGFDIDR